MILNDGQMFRFDMDDEPGDAARVTLPHKEIIDTLQEVSKLYCRVDLNMGFQADLVTFFGGTVRGC